MSERARKRDKKCIKLIKYAKSLSIFKRKIKDYKLRKCKLCQIKEIGNEFHYIYICIYIYIYFLSSYVNNLYIDLIRMFL